MPAPATTFGPTQARPSGFTAEALRSALVMFSQVLPWVLSNMKRSQMLGSPSSV